MAEQALKSRDWGEPTRMESRDLPAQSFVDWDDVETIRAIRQAHDQGKFMASALLVDGMLADDRVQACTSTRVGGLIGSDIVFRGRPGAEKQVAMLAGEAGEPGLYQRMFPPELVGELLLWGLYEGIGLGELLWNTDGPGGQWIPRLKVWHPQFVYWLYSTMSYWVITQDGPVELPNTDKAVNSDGHWLLYTPRGFRYGWQRALVRSLMYPYLIRGWGYRDWARSSEVHGVPGRKAIVPMRAEKAAKTRFINLLANLGSEPVIECPTAGDGEKWDFELVEAQAQSHEGFQRLIEKAESSIAIDLLGHNLTTEVKGGGSYAAARVGDNIRLEQRRWDAQTLPRTIHEQALVWWARFNFGDETLAPLPEYQVDPPENARAKADVIATVANAIKTLTDAGAPLDVRAILRSCDVPLLDEKAAASASVAPTEPPATDAVAPADDSDSNGGAAKVAPITITPTDVAAIVRVDEARLSMQLPRFGEGGNLTIAAFKAKNATTIAEGVAAGEGKTPASPPAPTEEATP